VCMPRHTIFSQHVKEMHTFVWKVLGIALTLHLFLPYPCPLRLVGPRQRSTGAWGQGETTGAEGEIGPYLPGGQGCG
jgi:hypothetical protein